MMIHVLRYEPRGHRQRFEPQEQQRGEQQDRHIHLHFHLNLTFRARQGRSTPPNAIRAMKIFAALVGATVMPLGFFIFPRLAHDGPPTTLGNLAWVILFGGLALAWGAVLVLLFDLWRESPRGRFGLFLPLVLLLSIPFFLQHGLWFGAIVAPLMSLVIGLLFLLYFFHPLITALLLLCVSREARTLNQTAAAHSKLSFVVVSGMVLTLLGGLLLSLNNILSGAPLIVFLTVMCGAVVVAICTLFELFRSHESTQARPKEASSSDVDSSRERG